jgi:phosphate transport system substrate-binding protein
MKKFLLLAAVLAGLLGLLGLSGPAATQPHGVPDAMEGRLLVSGSSTMKPLIQAMARRFEELHPRVRVEISSGGSARGLADVREGRVDVGMVARALVAAEQDLRTLPIARDGVALLVHLDNPVPALSHAQVAALYSGVVTNWKPLGGRDEPILSIAGEPGRGSQEIFAQYFGLSASQVHATRTEGDNTARLQLLRDHPNAIGYLSVGEAERSVRAGAPLRLLAEDGVDASSRNVGKGDYPLVRPLTLVTQRQPGALARAFVAFCASSQVTDLIAAHDFVPYLD